MAENKYISELSGNTNPSLTGYTVYDDGTSTYKLSLQTLKDTLFVASSSYATLSGNTFQGSQTINGNLVVTGSITAQQYVVSSSVYHVVETTVSGSSNFGNSLDDTHIFTGSLKVTGSITSSYFVGDGSQLTNLPLSHLATTSSLNSISNSVNTLISQTGSYLTSLPNGLISGSSQLPSGIVSGSSQISDLGFAITGSNLFLGDQTIRGTVIIGTGSLHGGNPEVLSVANSGSYNIGYFTGKSDTYAQINIQNVSDNSGASTDLVLTADNGSETNHYINLGINSSGWMFQTASIGYQNDGYLYNVGQDMYIGTMEPASADHGHLHLFASNSWNNPQITIFSEKTIAFNTGSVTTGFTYEFSGSVKLKNDLSVNGNQTISGSKYLAVETIQNLSGSLNLITDGDSVQILGSNLNVLNGGIITNFNVSASAFTGSLDWLYLINVPSLVSGSSQISNLGYAITGSNTFNGYQIISGSIYMGTGSIVLSKGTEIYDIGIPGSTSGIGLGNNGFNIDFGSNVNDWAIFQNARIIQMAPTDQFTIFITSAGEYAWNFNALGMGFPDGTNQITAYPGPIETGSFAVTGSNIFIGDQTINGSLIIEGVSEALTVDGGFNGNRTFDYTSGSIFYLTGVTGNGTWNVQNVPTTNNKAIALTYVIEQGVTPYSSSQYQINGSNVTVKWVDNTIPTGSANNTEIIGLTAFRVGSSWNVIGSLSTFGV